MITMTNTPETNAAEDRCTRTGFKLGYVDAEFAAQLERERDQWRECAERLAGVAALAEFERLFEIIKTTPIDELIDVQKLKQSLK